MEGVRGTEARGFPWPLRSRPLSEAAPATRKGTVSALQQIMSKSSLSSVFPQLHKYSPPTTVIQYSKEMCKKETATTKTTEDPRLRKEKI